MKRFLLLAIFFTLSVLTFGQRYYISHKDISRSQDRSEGRVMMSVYYKDVTVDMHLAGNGEEGYGAYIEFSNEGRYYVTSWLRSQNTQETKFIIVRNGEFTTVTLFLDTITLHQLNNNDQGIWAVYYYQTMPVTDEWLNEQVKE